MSRVQNPPRVLGKRDPFRSQFVPFRFDVDALRDWRSREVWGARYRRPEAYRRLRAEG